MIENNLFNPPSTKAYAIKSNSQEMQLRSTSGGLFSILSAYVFSNDGIVYGARYSEDFNTVYHDRVTDMESLAPFRNSKYVQSRLGGTYKKVKEDLSADKYVLFTGTSCQIAGLKCFLGRDYKKLLLVDVLCHGIPSPQIWSNYVNALKKEHGEIVKLVQRGKKTGGWSWRHQFMHITFANGKELKENIWENSYMLGFLKDLYLRPCCHYCQFKNDSVSRVSDITIADYWGCEEIEKDFFDGNGVSLAIINSQKGLEVLDRLKNCDIKETSLVMAGKHNSAIYRSYAIPVVRKQFFRKYSSDLSLEEFSDLVKQCCKKENTLEYRIIRKIKKVIKKIIGR